MNNKKITKFIDILEAKNNICTNIIKTPLIFDFELSKKFNSNIFYKLENLQRTGSFKIRGAYNKIYNSLHKISKNGILAWSSGNHAQGVAEAASIFNIKCTIIMPNDAPKIKIEGTKIRGAKIIFYNRKYENREEIGKKIAQKENLIIIPPYDDKYIIAGQGTIGLEISNQIKKYKLEPTNVLVPTGGGGLISGIAIAIKNSYKNCNIYAVEPNKFNDYTKSLEQNKIVKNNLNNTSICDSLLAVEPGKLTYEINKKLIKKGLIVTDKEVLNAINYAYKNLKIILEPGGAVALAAILNKKIKIEKTTTIAVLSGSNIDPIILQKSLNF